MWTPLSRLLAFLAALTLLVPATAVLAQSGPGPGDDDAEPAASDPSGADPDDDGNATASGNNSSRADEHRQGPRGENETENGTDDDGTDGGPGASASGGRGAHDDDDDEAETEDDDAGEGHGQGDERSAEVRRNFEGGFTTTDTSVDGRFVDFTLTDAGVSGYSVGGILVLDSATCDPAIGADEVEAHGSELEAEGPGGEFKAVDNPTGHFRIECDDGAVTLDLASGFTATLVDGSRVLIEGPDGFTAVVKGDHNDTEVSGDQITTGDDASFRVHAPGLRGILGPEIEEAIDDGVVAGEVNVHRGQGRPETDELEHGDVDIQAEEHPDRVVIHVSGEGPGKTILINVERDALGRAEDMILFFDGERMVHATDLADVTAALDGEEPEFLLVVGPDATQVLVGVPHFSDHTIEVQSLNVALPVTAPGSVMAFALAVVGAALFVGATWAARSRRR